MQKPYETIEERKNGVVVRRFLKGKLLGKGGFAKAYWATCLQTQKQFAMKASVAPAQNETGADHTLVLRE